MAPTSSTRSVPATHTNDATHLWVIGDSHASLFSGVDGLQPVWPEPSVAALPGVHVARLGPRLAHSLTRPGHEVRAQIADTLAHAPKDAAILLAFGEIDCRCHVVPHAHASNRSPAAVASELARSFVHAARDLIPVQRLGFMAAPPPPRQDVSDPAFPTRGSFEDRTQATRAFNETLAASAKALGLAVVSIDDELTDERGIRRESCFRDLIHCRVVVLPALCRRLIECDLYPARESLRLLAAADALSQVPWRPAASTVYTPLRLTQTLPPHHDLPAAIEAALLDRAALECVWLGASRVAVFGAGRHTQRVGLDFLRSRGLDVVAILDDQPKSPELLGVPVVAPTNAATTFDAVVISSDAHEHALAKRAATMYASRGIPIIRIYAWREPWPAAE